MPAALQSRPARVETQGPRVYCSRLGWRDQTARHCQHFSGRFITVYRCLQNKFKAFHVRMWYEIWKWLQDKSSAECAYRFLCGSSFHIPQNVYIRSVCGAWIVGMDLDYIQITNHYGSFPTKTLFRLNYLHCHCYVDCRFYSNLLH